MGRVRSKQAVRNAEFGSDQPSVETDRIIVRDNGS